jgi:SOS response regulatory protein OraA/RecX
MSANYNEKKYSPQRLKDYALWYYFRYYPSDGRLLQKLNEKWEEHDAQQVFAEIKHLLQEDEIIKAKIDNYLFRNKNFRYIQQKMREKLFPVEKTQAYLEPLLESWKSILTESFLRKKIENFANRGKSRSYIFYSLWETAADREILENLLNEYFPDGESENIEREYQKIISSKPELLTSRIWKQKIIQKLLSKWFKYDEVKMIVFN